MYRNSNLRFRLRVQTFSKDACRHLGGGWVGIENEEKLTAEEAQKSFFFDNLSRGPRQLINYAFNGLPPLPPSSPSNEIVTASSPPPDTRQELITHFAFLKA